MKKWIKRLEDVDESLRKHYVKSASGGYSLRVEEADSDDDSDSNEDSDAEDSDESDESSSKDKGKSKLDEFRRNNIKLMKERDALRKQLGEIDMDVYNAGKEAISRLQSDEEKELAAKGQFDKVLERRIAALKEQHAKELKKVQDDAAKAIGRAEKLRTDLKRTKIESYVRKAGDDMKVELASPTASQDLMRRAFDLFDIDEDGNVVSMDGDEPRLNKDGAPYTTKDFYAETFESASHLFKEGSGSGPTSSGTRQRNRQPGALDIDPTNPTSMGKNIDAIAKGKAKVRIVGN